MRKSIKMGSIIIALLMVFSVTACKPDNGFTVDKGTAETVKAQVWTMPSTVKVLQGEDYSEFYTKTPALAYEIAQNEYEGLQILINPETDVAYYDLEISNLVSDSGDILGSSNMQVYNQWYVDVTRRTALNSGRPLGYYPDALVPFASAKEYKENKIKAGKNQGIWITIKTDIDTPAGIYKGNFKLTINKQEQLIPVSVNVWGFAIPDETHARSTFNMFQEYLMGGLLSNTKETYQSIVDFLLEYRVSTWEIVSEDYSLEDWTKLIIKYAQNPKVSSYNVNTTARLRSLIENSTPQLNLLKKAYIFLMDEPYNTPENPGMLAEAQKRSDNKIQELISIANSYTPEQYKKFGLTKDDIWGIETMVTLDIGLNRGTVDGLRTYCPLVSDLDTQHMRDVYAQARADANKGINNELAGTDFGSTWWYVCVSPQEPYPNYNIDMDLSASRVVSWMQYNYDIEGMLYWGTATYDLTVDRNKPGGWTSTDVYEVANGVYAPANGDGYLLYPGAKYGKKEVFPSIRLESIRDGFEDYEYLYMLEELSAAAAKKYGLSNFNFDTMMDSIYSTLYTGTKANSNYNLVMQSRRKIAKMIELLASDANAIMTIGDIDPIAKTVPIEIVAKNGTILVSDGKTITGSQTASGNGVVLQYTLDLSKNSYFVAELKNGSEVTKINEFIANSVKSVSQFESSADIAKWTASKPDSGEHIVISQNSNAAYNKLGNGSMHAVISPKPWINAEVMNYTQCISISATDLLGTDKMSDLDYIAFYLYNNSGFEYSVSVELEGRIGTGKPRLKDIYKINLSQGWNYVKIPNINKLEWEFAGGDYMKNITSLKLVFPLDNARTYDIYLDNLYYSYAK